MSRGNGSNGNGDLLVSRRLVEQTADIERGVLGMLLLHGTDEYGKRSEEIAPILAQLDESLFSSAKNAALFAAVSRTYSEGLGVDPNTVRAHLPIDVCGCSEVSRCLESVPLLRHLPAYVQRLREAKARRELIGSLLDGAKRSGEGEDGDGA